MIARIAAAVMVSCLVGCSISDPTTRPGKLIINEILVKNSGSSGVIAPDGSKADYIELYNAGDDTIWLNNYFLTDNRSVPTKRNLPVRKLAPNEFAVFYGGNSKVFPEDFLGFGLSSDSASGESVILVDSTITPVDSLNYLEHSGSMKKGKSFGRLGDGGTIWVVQKNPTPGKPNNQ